MRSSEDLCLLCKTRKATKTDSHIISKFLTKSVFGQGQRRGFLLDADNSHKPAKITQDAAKESYILCPECEKCFEILETYISSKVHNRLWNPQYANEFRDEDNGHGIKRRVCINTSPIIFRLLIYSIVWRRSISETPAHRSFKLENGDEEYLRKILCYFYAHTQDGVLQKVTNDPTIAGDIPFILFTSQSFSDATGNVIATLPYARSPHFIELNQYSLWHVSRLRYNVLFLGIILFV